MEDKRGGQTFKCSCSKQCQSVRDIVEAACAWFCMCSKLMFANMSLCIHCKTIWIYSVFSAVSKALCFSLPLHQVLLSLMLLNICYQTPHHWLHLMTWFVSMFLWSVGVDNVHLCQNLLNIMLALTFSCFGDNCVLWTFHCCVVWGPVASFVTTAPVTLTMNVNPPCRVSTPRCWTAPSCHVRTRAPPPPSFALSLHGLLFCSCSLVCNVNNVNHIWSWSMLQSDLQWMLVDIEATANKWQEQQSNWNKNGTAQTISIAACPNQTKKPMLHRFFFMLMTLSTPNTRIDNKWTFTVIIQLWIASQPQWTFCNCDLLTHLAWQKGSDGDCDERVRRVPCRLFALVLLCEPKNVPLRDSVSLELETCQSKSAQKNMTNVNLLFLNIPTVIHCHLWCDGRVRRVPCPLFCSLPPSGCVPKWPLSCVVVSSNWSTKICTKHPWPTTNHNFKMLQAQSGIVFGMMEELEWCPDLCLLIF